MSAINNLARYSSQHVVAYYEKLDGLQNVEEYVFGKYVPIGSDVIDIGVGGGRTARWLSRRARTYLGVDYAQAMVDKCRERFPDLDFECGDATNLSMVADAAFDVAVFSFNGIDSIGTDSGRARCLAEMRRVVRPNGFVIISSHNARQLAQYPNLHGADYLRKSWRIVRAVARTPMLLLRALRSKAFYEGSGYVTDPVHGGLHIHLSTPESVARDVSDAGLSIVEVVGGYYPACVSRYLTNWYYYVLRPSTRGT